MAKRGKPGAGHARPRRRELVAALESWDVAVVASAPDGEITRWNAAAARLYGYQPDEVLGHPITLLVPPDDVKAADAVLDRARAGEPVNDIRARHRRKDGGLVGVTLNVSPVLRRGTVVSIVVSARDVGAQHAEKALVAKERKAGKLELETVDFDLAQLVEEVAELVAEPARHKGVEVLASCDPGLESALSGDANRIRQVLLNLASNAVKFTAEGEVIVAARRHVDSDGLVVRFEVTDTGIGIGAEHRDRLFEPFSQADASTTQRFGGTGLGLAISRQLVEAMGGEIGLDSEVGRGSTFWFTVPLEPQPEVSAPQHVTDSLQGLRVVVVDDNQTNRLILYQQLSAWGLHPEVVPDGPGGLERLQEAASGGAPFGLAILDLHMPGMDGLELAGRIAGDPALAGMPLILLTSGGDVDTEEARRLGIVARLTKPVRQSYLYNCLLRIASGPVEAPARPAARIIPTGPGAAEWSGRVRRSVALLERVRLAVEERRLPHRAGGAEGVVTVSAGVAAWQPGDQASPEDVLKAADSALYQAKSAGRNRVVGFNG